MVSCLLEIRIGHWALLKITNKDNTVYITGARAEFNNKCFCFVSHTKMTSTTEYGFTVLGNVV